MSPHAAAVLGIAPHSGWAAAVLLGGTAAAPPMVLRERLELADEELPGSRQPYHELERLPLPEAERRLDSAGRSGATLAAILASHALIHTADGNHFRDALEEGCEALGLPVARIAQRELAARATVALRRSPQQLATCVKELGRGMGSPWGADQKSAALLAWLLLETGQGPARGRES